MCRTCDSLKSYLEGGGAEVYGTGLSPSAFAWFLAASCPKALTAPVIIITPDQKSAELFRQDLLFFGGPEGSLFPPPDILPYLGLKAHPDRSTARVAVLQKLAEPKGDIIVAPLEAAAWKTAPPAQFVRQTTRLGIGDTLEREALLTQLIDQGYERTELVTDPGTLAIRGSLLDIFPAASPVPIRIDFFGDRIDAIRPFNPESQISTGEELELVIPPASEAAIAKDQPGTGSLLDYLPPGARLFMVEPDFGWQKVTNTYQEVERLYLEVSRSSEGRRTSPPTPEQWMVPPQILQARLDALRHVVVSRLENPSKPFMVRQAHYERFVEGFSTNGPYPFALSLSKGGVVMPTKTGTDSTAARVAVFTELRKQAQDGETIIIAAGTPSQAKRIRHFLEGSPSIQIVPRDLSEGFSIPEHRLTVLNETDLFGAKKKRPPSPKPRPVGSAEDLALGDFIVHADHGVGIFRGMTVMEIGSETTDFILLEYLGGDKLYIPVDRLALIARYVGGDRTLPHLTKLGSPAWHKAKARASLMAKRLAQDLLHLYARRATATGYSFSPDSDDMTAFEASFPYDETSDQLRAIAEVKQDMQRDKPMDRLLVGDVGYGKTEVVLRAAFKAVMDGRQAAVLVPTTILALQHFETFKERLASHPVRVEMLSRFRSPKEQKETIVALAAGTVDMVIGTHRLLQPDIRFKNLGLLAIDEEHRFGVRDKERIKKLKGEVDTLALSATPIPRTLYMSLAGIRDLSIIMSPPEERLAIRTFVAPASDLLIKEAISQEIARGGQVYFVHNRVETIDKVCAHLQSLLPGIRTRVAHGQMEEHKLEQVMTDFYHHESDLLVTTTIIESGLDVPRANTILIDRADTFGLAQLYQLRGRVGRSNLQAFAYLLISGEATMTADGKKRLAVLQKFAQLGSGWGIASHDLEIRGAGNLLGKEQSGQMGEIGYDLYTQMLKKAVSDLKGEATEPDINPEIHLPVAAFLPERYVPDAGLRLALYRQLSRVETAAEIEPLRREWRDRFGPLPAEAGRLLDVISVKILAKSLRILKIQAPAAAQSVTFYFDDNRKLTIDLAPEQRSDLLGAVVGSLAGLPLPGPAGGRRNGERPAYP